MTILALDQASRTSGYAVFCDDQLIDSGKFTFEDTDIAKRLMKIRNKVEELIAKKCRACEMESFGLFYNAYKLACNAACILTISDNILTGEETTSKERQNSFNEMIKLALETCLELD